MRGFFRVPTIPGVINLRFMTRDKRNAESHTQPCLSCKHLQGKGLICHLSLLSCWEGKKSGPHHYLFRMLKVTYYFSSVERQTV